MKFRRRMDRNFFMILILFHLQNAFADDERNSLKRILNYNSKMPLIALLYKNKNKAIEISDAEPDDDITPDVNSVSPPHDQKLYNLYTILRSAQENEDIDPKAAEKFEKTENVLREALRERCNRLDTCVKKCPKKKKYTCTFTCKETYDDYDVCEKPKKKKCKKQKCGKTMPPSWILRD